MTRSKWMILAVLFTIIFIAFTFVIKNFDVATVTIGEEAETSIGLSGINLSIRDAVGTNELFGKISTLIMGVGFGCLLVLGLVWLVQIFRERSFTGVDCELYAYFLLCIVTAALYLFFEKFIINYRPVLDNGKLEASYPSSHVLITISLIGGAMLFARARVLSNTMHRLILAGGILLMAAETACRILSGKHWITDIAAAILLGIALLLWYETLSCKCKRRNLRNADEAKIENQAQTAIDSRHEEYERQSREYRR